MTLDHLIEDARRRAERDTVICFAREDIIPLMEELKALREHADALEPALELSMLTSNVLMDELKALREFRDAFDSKNWSRMLEARRRCP